MKTHRTQVDRRADREAYISRWQICSARGLYYGIDELIGVVLLRLSSFKIPRPFIRVQLTDETFMQKVKGYVPSVVVDEVLMAWLVRKEK